MILIYLLYTYLWANKYLWGEAIDSDETWNARLRYGRYLTFEKTPSLELTGLRPGIHHFSVQIAWKANIHYIVCPPAQSSTHLHIEPYLRRRFMSELEVLNLQSRELHAGEVWNSLVKISIHFVQWVINEIIEQ